MLDTVPSLPEDRRRAVSSQRDMINVSCVTTIDPPAVLDKSIVTVIMVCR